MKYRFSYQNPLEHFIDVQFEIENILNDEITLHLPSWRPGRYEIANFAKNIKQLAVYNGQNEPIEVHKISKDSWSVNTRNIDYLVVHYSYYAFAMDAGNSWLDEHQLYLNFINCCLYVEGRLDEVCEVELDVPSDYESATGLEKLGQFRFKANTYYQLVDSPLISSNSLKRIQYDVDQVEFNIWIQGELPRTDDQVIADFKSFTEKQIAVMGPFPCKDYHFLFQCLPYRHYHGVEHFNSTTIAIGPSEELAERPRYKKLLGVSCHELFHTWNVIRLRPKEMVPYNFKSENYHKTGFVTEGITTYYGDLFLVRSGVWSVDEFLEELNDMLKRHFENPGRTNMSVADSSFDLWLDGYQRGVPGRKVSIYNEGGLAALILDLKIRLKWNHQRSLDDVMRMMWDLYGKNFSGYTLEDYQKCAETVFDESLCDYFNDYILGTTPFDSALEGLFDDIDLKFKLQSPEKVEERIFGFRLSGSRITLISASSPASQLLSIKDRILKVNGEDFEDEMEFRESPSIELEIDRFSRIVKVTLEADGLEHFQIYQVALHENQQSTDLVRWLEQ